MPLPAIPHLSGDIKVDIDILHRWLTVFQSSFQNASNEAVFGELASGIIMMWSGPTDAIPGGWSLCDGSNGTPDLRDKFIVGAGSTYGVGDTGGLATVTLGVTELPSHSHIQDIHTHVQSPHTHIQDSHTHTIQAHGSTTASVTGTHLMTSDTTGGTSRTMVAPDGANGTISVNQNATATNQGATATNQSTGGGLPHENRPPFYALAYIMKV